MGQGLYSLLLFLFYDDSILPGTKTSFPDNRNTFKFYDDSILPGTKTEGTGYIPYNEFYDDSILPGTKTISGSIL